MCVCMSVCLSVKSHLTSGASVRPEIDIMYTTSNEGQKICGIFSETALLRRSSSLRHTAICIGGHFSHTCIILMSMRIPVHHAEGLHFSAFHLLQLYIAYIGICVPGRMQGKLFEWKLVLLKYAEHWIRWDAVDKKHSTLLYSILIIAELHVSTWQIYPHMIQQCSIG